MQDTASNVDFRIKYECLAPGVVNVTSACGYT